MIGGDGFQVAMPAIILTVRTHRQEWHALDRLALSEDMGEVVIEHFAKVLEIPADAGNLRNRLTADLSGLRSAAAHCQKPQKFPSW
jgi:hypothetical protein